MKSQRVDEQLRIPLSSPDITEREIAAVTSVLRSLRLSLGPKLEEFEDAMAAYIGVPHCVAVSSGTAGLHLALEGLGIGEGDEVILPSFTFIAAANAVLYRRATPVFADIDAVTLNLDPASVERAITPKTRALLVVHTFGCPADMERLLAIAKQHNLRVIEDACEAIGAEYAWKRVGVFGDASVFSFYPNKPITTGEGGVILMRDEGLAGKLRALRNQGRKDSDGWLEHSLLGYNYRLPEINCVLGIEQLARIENILEQRAMVAQRYSEALGENADLVTPISSISNGKVSWFTYVVRLASGFTREDRDAVIRSLMRNGIGCRNYFPPIHLQALYAGYALDRRSLSVTEEVGARTIALPFFNKLTAEEIAEVAVSLREAIQRRRKT